MALPRIGSVPYLNAAPLIEGLGDVVREVPSALAERFSRGEVDVALLPSFVAVREPSRPILPGICVASPGPVDSVLLFSPGPLEAAERVRLDESSLTSVALARILLCERSGIDPEFVPCPADTDPRRAGGDAVLLIGDRALTAPRDGLVVTDLATLWREWTGLPFCFAVWIARNEAAAAAAIGPLAAAKERGLARRAEIARDWSDDLGIPAPELETYLTERITYDLGAPERAGLERYGERCRKLGLA